ncbi:MAG: FAD-dependent oxidoreductase [Hyphomonadaceae bacterium]
MATPNKIVILGAGQAGAQAAYSLRGLGYEGEIRIVGDEPAPPYQRPPLSKAYLKGEMDAERLWLKPESFYADHRIDLALGAEATAIDLHARTVDLGNGGKLDWDGLVIATGARPKRLPVPGADLQGVHVLRTLRDVDGLKPVIKEGARMVVVGAGYIGLEAAAVGRQLGAEVVVLEAAPQVLGRVAGPEIAAFYERLHRERGVDIRLNARLATFEGPGAVSGVRMADGELIACDLVLLGVGVAPNLEIAREAGLTCGDGVVVDAEGRTSHPGVFAAGDVAWRPLVPYGREGRLESVHNAIEGGKIAASGLLGAAPPVLETPWFWSDQYEIKLQTAGLSGGADQRVVRGDPESARFAVFYLREGTLLAVDAVNSGPEFIVGKKLTLASASVAPGELADTSISMKDILARASAAGAA